MDRGSQQAPVWCPPGLQKIRGLLQLQGLQSFPSLCIAPSTPGFPPLCSQALEPFSCSKAFVSSWQSGRGTSKWVSLPITTIGPAGWASGDLLSGGQGCKLIPAGVPRIYLGLTASWATLMV